LLEELSRKEREELALLLEEKERRREQEAIRYYNKEKRHEKQIAFHKSPKRIRALFGGNRTGKTVGGSVEGVWYATGEHPYKKDIKPYINRPNRGWVVSLTNEVQRDVAQKEILKWLRPDQIHDVVMRVGAKTDYEHGIIDLLMVKHISGGISTIGFKTVEQGREKFQGTSQHWIWADEEIPKEIYDECLMRLLDTQGDFWTTMTPLKGLTWTYEVIYENRNANPEVQYWQMQWSDNPFLTQSEIKYLESTLTEEEREARQYGRFVALSGLVYKEFDPDIHVIDPFPIPHGWYDKLSIDPGYSAPLSGHFYACDEDKNIYVIAEHYVKEKKVEWHAKTLKEMAKKMEWPFTKSGKILSVMDTAATQRTIQAQQTAAELFTQHGIIPQFVNKDVFVGIQRVKEYLTLRELPDDHPEKEKYPNGKPKLFIFSTCVNMIREMKKYRWEETNNGEASESPKKINDHAMDELRYYVMSRPNPFEEEPEHLKGCYLKSELIDKGFTNYQIKQMVARGEVNLIG
jgi:phage terminase large subunit-like protein